MQRNALPCHPRLGSPGNPCCVGEVDNPRAKVVRIVHISDTHALHWELTDVIPGGDILIHTGDFANYYWPKAYLGSWDYHSDMRELDTFFAALPHTYKLFVAGNHELNFTRQPQEKTQSLLRHGIYLQDSTLLIEGIKIYGTPWNELRISSNSRGFTAPLKKLQDYWKLIPDDTDILVTHSPPKYIMDHHGELGCPHLKEAIYSRIRPKAQLFGHAHESNGIFVDEGIVFSNASMKSFQHANIIDYYIDPEKSQTIIPTVEEVDTGPSCVLS